MKQGHMDEEIWKAVVGYEGFYDVSNLGRVKSLFRMVPWNGTMRPIRERIMVGGNQNAYRSVLLRKDNAFKTFSFHRIVATAFIPNPLNLPMVNHKDGNKLNNRLENLEWVTLKQNAEHASKSGLMNSMNGETNPKAKLSENDVQTIRQEFSIGACRQELASRYSVSRTCIRSITTRKTWRHI